MFQFRVQVLISKGVVNYFYVTDLKSGPENNDFKSYALKPYYIIIIIMPLMKAVLAVDIP